MAENLSILEFLQKMIDDVGLRDWFADDPQGALAHYGLRDVSPEDVRDAIVLADDSQTADFSRSVDNGFHGTVGAAAAHHSATAAATTRAGTARATARPSSTSPATSPTTSSTTATPTSTTR